MNSTFGILHDNMNDSNGSLNFFALSRNRNVRSQNRLPVSLYRNDYSYDQLIAKQIRLINELSVIFENVNVRTLFNRRVRHLVRNRMNLTMNLY